VLQIRGDSDLAQEPLGAEDRAELGIENFHGDVAVVLEIAREVDGRHPAAPDFALDAIAIAHSGGKCRGQDCISALIRHRLVVTA
jgi:hypothetical protein